MSLENMTTGGIPPESGYHPYPPEEGARARSTSQTLSVHSEGPITRNRSAELASSAIAAILSDVVALHPFYALGSNQGSREPSLQTRVFGPPNANDGKAAGAPPSAAPPLVPQLTPSFAPPEPWL